MLDELSSEEWALLDVALSDSDGAKSINYDLHTISSLYDKGLIVVTKRELCHDPILHISVSYHPSEKFYDLVRAIREEECLERWHMEGLNSNSSEFSDNE